IMAESVKASLSSIVQNLNAKHNDVPLFNGTNFKDVPVILDAAGKAVLSNADFSGEIKAQVSQDVKQTLNIPGSKILGSGIFQAVNSIIDSLNAGIIPTIDQKADLEDAYNQILDLQSLGGQTMNRMDDLNEMLTNNQANLNQMLADKQGIDPAALSMDLQYKDYLLEMTNKLLANNYPKSLFDYL
ncbi:MAG: flagellin, partial [Melioribacteraceae bacterium]